MPGQPEMEGKHAYLQRSPSISSAPPRARNGAVCRCRRPASQLVRLLRGAFWQAAVAALRAAAPPLVAPVVHQAGCSLSDSWHACAGPSVLPSGGCGGPSFSFWWQNPPCCPFPCSARPCADGCYLWADLIGSDRVQLAAALAAPPTPPPPPQSPGTSANCRPLEGWWTTECRAGQGSRRNSVRCCSMAATRGETAGGAPGLSLPFRVASG